MGKRQMMGSSIFCHKFIICGLRIGTYQTVEKEGKRREAGKADGRDQSKSKNQRGEKDQDELLKDKTG